MSLFLIVLLIVIGYFLLLIWITSKAGDRYSISFLMIISLFIYCPLLGICIALGNYLGEIGLLLYGLFIIYCLFYWVFKIRDMVLYRPRMRNIIIVALFAYILAVLYITIFMRTEGSNDRVQMTLFDWISGSGQESIEHVLQNVAMFIPIGFFCYIMYQDDAPKRKLLFCFSSGLTFSVIIETIQLFFSLGTCDIDDIIANSLGAVLGAAVVFIYECIRSKHRS